MITYQNVTFNVKFLSVFVHQFLKYPIGVFLSGGIDDGGHFTGDIRILFRNIGCPLFSHFYKNSRKNIFYKLL
jgi:hypothetical protein